MKLSSTITDTTTCNQEDLVMSMRLHGESWEEANHQTSLISKLSNRDHETQRVATENYLGNWRGERPDDETEDDRTKRQNEYKAVANSYYDLATDFYEFGWGRSFHFCRFYRGEPIHQAIARYEHYLAANMNIQSHYKVLDIGSGIGGPAFQICHFTGAHITGLNNNDYQINRAKGLAVEAGLDERTTFIKGDFMHMPITSNSFDACYAIEATDHASTLEGVYGEAYRILKPGGVFGCYEWVFTDNFDPTDQEHLRIARGIEIGNGVAKMRTAKECVQALKNVGFVVEKAFDSAANGDKIKWYYPLQGDIRKANSVWDYPTLLRTSYFGRTAATYLLKIMEKLHLVPPGSTTVQKILETSADSLVEGAIAGIFTPMFFFIARKPGSITSAKNPNLPRD
ncbi:Delta(24)-sterol C-methyltransferase [Podila clonocystis]|nr:Delta(24)-sterol C-methyltransferase [Podila clonocystis]